jgi:hypothetical protein
MPLFSNSPQFPKTHFTKQPQIPRQTKTPKTIKNSPKFKTNLKPKNKTKEQPR